MGLKSKIFALIILGISVWLGLKYKESLEPVKIPQFEDTWWGPRKPHEEDNFVRKFEVNISDSIIQDLNTRLAQARPFQEPLEGAQHHYGINTKLLEKIVTFWKEEYKWKRREKIFNKFPQYTVSVQGLKIHYIHIKPREQPNIEIVPLLLLHGWPGSVREFYELIPKLVEPMEGKNFMFEVLVPSLPGYGFSEAAVRPGLGAIQAAVLFKNFMKRLDKGRFYVQGGDWGSVITQHMATLFPEHVLGVHSNMCNVNTPASMLLTLLGALYPPLAAPESLRDKIYPLGRFYSNLLLESGYFHLQATKPDTIGVALNDSPVGLAAYILEKFIAWTNPQYKDREDGGLTERFSYISLLDNVMLYWVTGTITTSMRFYAETINKDQMSLGIDNIPIVVPSACAVFPHEMAHQSPSLYKYKYQNMVQVSILQEGGHFAAFEVPDILAKDIFDAVEKMLAFNAQKHRQKTV